MVLSFAGCYLNADLEIRDIYFYQFMLRWFTQRREAKFMFTNAHVYARLIGDRVRDILIAYRAALISQPQA